MTKLKRGDVLMCINVEPAEFSPKNLLAKRQLKLGALYTVQRNQGLTAGVWLEENDTYWHDWRFQKVGTL